MSVAELAAEPCAEALEESLAERLSRGSLPEDEALQHSIAIAASLRDLHKQGLVYGAVSAQVIVLRVLGACMSGSRGLAQFGDSREDVKAFGAVLGEILRRSEGSDEFRVEMERLARLCREETPEMRYVLTRLRLLRLRQNLPANHGLRPALVPLPAAPATTPKIRLRIRMALHWRPLVNLVAAALAGR